VYFTNRWQAVNAKRAAKFDGNGGFLRFSAIGTADAIPLTTPPSALKEH
jgi:hypothetical protein